MIHNPFAPGCVIIILNFIGKERNMKNRFSTLIIPLLIIISLLTLSSCAGDQAEELFKTAQFEELQNNREHARQLYGELLRKYPGSEYAKKAEDRLADLGK